jgi:hypothetical protein
MAIDLIPSARHVECVCSTVPCPEVRQASRSLLVGQSPHKDRGASAGAISLSGAAESAPPGVVTVSFGVGLSADTPQSTPDPAE